MDGCHDLRCKEHRHQANHAADHAGLPELLSARAADHVRDQELKRAGDESERGQCRSDRAASVGEVADEAYNRCHIHSERPFVPNLTLPAGRGVRRHR